MPPVVTRCTDRVRFIAPSDPAVVWPDDPEERAKAELAYSQSYDTSTLKLQGTPIVWHIRPLYMADLRALSREAPQIGEDRIALASLPEPVQEQLRASADEAGDIVLPIWHEDRTPSILCRGVAAVDEHPEVRPVWTGHGERRALLFSWARTVPTDIADDVAGAIMGLSVASETLKKSSFWRRGKA